MSTFSVNPIFVTAVLGAIAPAFVLYVIVSIVRKRRAKVERPPQNEKLLRPPGHSLTLLIESMQEKAVDWFLWACGLCAMSGALVVPVVNLWRVGVPTRWILLFLVPLIAFAVAGALMSRLVFRQWNEIRKRRLGLRGEQAVAETLHEVAADRGYRVFHDLPGGANWNIDHIVVGSRGVFVIETKARRKREPKKDKRPAAHEVEIDGEILRFSTRDDKEAIPQARRNAAWLTEYLKKRTAEEVTVEPLVCVPGYWVTDLEKSDPPKALNATYLAGRLRGQVEKISARQVRRIIAALDDKCRDVEF